MEGSALVLLIIASLMVTNTRSYELFILATEDVSNGFSLRRSFDPIDWTHISNVSTTIVNRINEVIEKFQAPVFSKDYDEADFDRGAWQNVSWMFDRTPIWLNASIGELQEQCAALDGIWPPVHDGNREEHGVLTSLLADVYEAGNSEQLLNTYISGRKIYHKGSGKIFSHNPTLEFARRRKRRNTALGTSSVSEKQSRLLLHLLDVATNVQ